MVVGALRLTFMIPPDGKSNHSAAHKIKDRLWTKFKIALSEIPSGAPSQLVIGGALVDHDENRMQERMDQIIRHLNDWGVVELVNDETDIIHFDDIELERDFEKYES
jgi:uncharacterized protein YlxP (DUF503 family)